MISIVKCCSLMYDEAEEVFDRYTKEHLRRGDIEQGQPVGTTKMAENVPSTSKNALTGLLSLAFIPHSHLKHSFIGRCTPPHIPRSHPPPLSKISFADTEPPVERQAGPRVPPRVTHVSAQKLA